ncbi:hypothetical protein H8E77_15155 [bacterium]|nr:hypothetical protein [bacterium]
MKIEFWDISQAAKLTDFYNEQIATVPYCYPVSPEEFERAVCYQLHEALEKHKMNADKELAVCSERRLIVGEQNGEVVGFADIGRHESEDKERDAVGLIRFMTYRPGCRPIGQAILEHALFP